MGEDLEKKVLIPRLEPGSDEWCRVLNAELPKTRVTEETRRVTSEMARRGYRTDMRIAMGLYKTDEEHEAWRRKVLGTPLP